MGKWGRGMGRLHEGRMRWKHGKHEGRKLYRILILETSIGTEDVLKYTSI